ncbi:RxLR effector protein [Plasmodiophora brassicae]|uniref:RxLR effector protein n=1 Tax=Plasmodiophora brassicae TaxID=37360 RepID=A0A0G4IGP3_PLABS|nr:hypothetical protein PBRA_000153 [Plasmodiophora brassicae]SPQ96716.1 unnamed protein product [Plasmodiophora brassicae]
MKIVWLLVLAGVALASAAPAEPQQGPSTGHAVVDGVKRKAGDAVGVVKKWWGGKQEAAESLPIRKLAKSEIQLPADQESNPAQSLFSRWFGSKRDQESSDEEFEVEDTGNVTPRSTMVAIGEWLKTKPGMAVAGATAGALVAGTAGLRYLYQKRAARIAKEDADKKEQEEKLKADVKSGSSAVLPGAAAALALFSTMLFV